MAEGKRLSSVLWIVQGLLALIFLFAGGTKLVLPIEEMTKEVALPGTFLRLLGVAEVLGALGLILPGLLRIRPGLTPLAAAGLVLIMIGATVDLAGDHGPGAGADPAGGGAPRDASSRTAAGGWRRCAADLARRRSRRRARAGRPVRMAPGASGEVNLALSAPRFMRGARR